MFRLRCKALLLALLSFRRRLGAVLYASLYSRALRAGLIHRMRTDGMTETAVGSRGVAGRPLWRGAQPTIRIIYFVVANLSQVFRVDEEGVIRVFADTGRSRFPESAINQ